MLEQRLMILIDSFIDYIETWKSTLKKNLTAVVVAVMGIVGLCFDIGFGLLFTITVLTGGWASGLGLFLVAGLGVFLAAAVATGLVLVALKVGPKVH